MCIFVSVCLEFMSYQKILKRILPSPPFIYQHSYTHTQTNIQTHNCIHNLIIINKLDCKIKLTLIFSSREN